MTNKIQLFWFIYLFLTVTYNYTSVARTQGRKAPYLLIRLTYEVNSLGNVQRLYIIHLHANTYCALVVIYTRFFPVGSTVFILCIYLT